MKHVSEQDLLQMIRHSDYGAFEELHHRYYGLLYTMAAKKTGDPDEAYDLVQNMFLELWEKRADFTITNTLEAWLKNRVWFKLSGYFRARGFREKHLQNFSLFLQQEQAVSIPEAELHEITAQYDAVIAVINQTVEDMPGKMLTAGGNIDIVYTKGKYTNVFEDAAFSTGKDKFNFSMYLRLEEIDNVTHRLAGVIDSLTITSKADTTKKITVKGAGFNLFYDHFELYLNDALAYEGTTNAYDNWVPYIYGSENNDYISQVYPQLYATNDDVPFKNKANVTLTFITPTAEGSISKIVSPFPYDNSSAEALLLFPNEPVEIGGEYIAVLQPVRKYDVVIEKAEAMINVRATVTTDSAKLVVQENYDDQGNRIPPAYLKNSPVYKVKISYTQKRL